MVDPTNDLKYALAVDMADKLDQSLCGVIKEGNVTVKSETGVSLAEAKHLGQLVRATSSESRYVCVFISDVFNAAARIKGSQVSIRVEPRAVTGKLTGYTESLSLLGLQINADGGYASAHFGGLSPRQQLQTVASLLMGLLDMVPSQSATVIHFSGIQMLPGEGV